MSTHYASMENLQGEELDAIVKAAGRAPKTNPMDDEDKKREHRRAMEWYWQEMDRQSVNRFQMAVDADFYDGDQYFSEDAQELLDRGQAPIVINEIAPMIDWIIGTQRRTRFDQYVAPRTEDDVEMADVKTKVLKYLSDVNRGEFVQSEAFSESVKSGLSWLEDDVQLDPTSEILYYRSESWRYVLWDSLCREKDLSDARYMFRWRWVDLDVAVAMFPDRRHALETAANKQQVYDSDEQDIWYMGQRLDDMRQSMTPESRGRWTQRSSADGTVSKRSRVRLIQCWYRKPVPVKLLQTGDDMDGTVYERDDPQHMALIEHGAATLVERTMMQMQYAIMTEGDMLRCGVQAHKHNAFPLTPVWCYRRGRDGLPYSAGRRVRDLQEDLNKRYSKAQYLLATNQIFGDEGAVEDWEEAREQVDRPDGTVVLKAGKRFEVRRDADMVKGQLELMQLNSAKIMRIANVNDDNMGRRTNAESGVAITARQDQGAVSSTEPLDNLRFACRVAGEKRLSLAEQYLTTPKVVRIAGIKGQFEWVKINDPELQADGSVRWLNDMTASKADFVMAEQDFSGTMRQMMFDAMSELAARPGIAPELALRLLRIAIEFSDFPNKDELAAEIRRISGDAPDKMNPEEEQAAAAMQEQQQKAAAMQEAMAQAALAKEQATAQKIGAEAAEIMKRTENPDVQDQAGEIRAEASRNLEAMAEQLRRSQGEVSELKARAAGDVQSAAIDAEAKVRVAEIETRAQGVSDALTARLEKLADAVANLEKPNAPK